MTVILTLIAGILFGALNVGFFAAGYYFGSKKEDEKGIELTRENKDLISAMAEWKNFDGR